MTDTAWGIAVTAYIFVGVAIMGIGNGAANRPQGLPGSAKVAAHDARGRRFQALMLLWIAGLVALLLAAGHI